jgi:hypothetical protein
MKTPKGFKPPLKSTTHLRSTCATETIFYNSITRPLRYEIIDELSRNIYEIYDFPWFELQILNNYDY